MNPTGSGPSKFLMISRTIEQNGGPPIKLVLFALPDNGMILGGVQDDTAQWGEDAAQAVRRSFTDHKSAVAWGKQQCRVYAGRDDVDFTEPAPEEKSVKLVSTMPMPRGRM